MNTTDDIQKAITSWVEKRRCKFGPFGRFKFARSSRCASLFASATAMLDVYDYFNMLGSLDEKKKTDWKDYLLSFQEPESGLFIDRRNRKSIQKDFVWERVEKADTVKTVCALKCLGAGPEYHIVSCHPKHLMGCIESTGALKKWIVRQDWDMRPCGCAMETYRAASLILEAPLPSDRQRDLLNVLHQFFEMNQNTKNRLWGNAACPDDELASAARIVFTIFGENGWPVPYQEEITSWIETVIMNQPPARHIEALRNRICLFIESCIDRSHMPMRMTGPRSFYTAVQEAIYRDGILLFPGEDTYRRIIDAMMQSIRPFQSRDGGFSYYTMGKATSHHNGVFLGQGKNEGDFLAVSHMSFVHAALVLLSEIAGKR